MNRKIHEKIAFDTFKEQNSYPSLEEIIPHVAYALTLSPKHVFKAYLEQYQSFVDHIRPCLVGNVVLRPELSTKNTRWHYHGTIQFISYSQITMFYQYLSELKEHSTIVLAEIEDFEWYLYCVKQRVHIKSYINKIYNSRRFNIPYCIRLTDNPPLGNPIKNKCKLRSQTEANFTDTLSVGRLLDEL